MFMGWWMRSGDRTSLMAGAVRWAAPAHQQPSDRSDLIKV
jgi:hypothetical protein